MSSSTVKADPASALTIRTVADAVTVAERLAGSSMIPSYIRSKEDALYILLTGAELGLGPAASFRGLFAIKGQVGMKYQLISARLRELGWRIKWLTESDDMARATLVLSKGDEEHRETYSIEQAKRAGVTSNDQWKKRPERMLRARALTGAADAVDGRIRMGLYAEDEVAEIMSSRSAPRVAQPPRVVEQPQPVAETSAEESIADGEIVCGASEPEQPEANCAAPRTLADCHTAEELQAWCGEWGARVASAGKLAAVVAHGDGIGVAASDVRRWCGAEEAAE